MTNTPADKRRRWRMRFSLRSLLVATLIFACGLGWYVSETRRAIRQQNAVAHIRDVGGHASYEHRRESTGNSKTIGQFLKSSLVGSSMGVDFLNDVRRVSIHHAHDADLEVIRSLSRLRDLRLNSQHVTDQGVCHLRRLKRLELLHLWCSQVTDQGLEPISHLTNLTELSLYGTQVTDAGLVHLHALTKLRLLKVRGTSITASGAARLRRALPNCKIEGMSILVEH